MGKNVHATLFLLWEESSIQPFNKYILTTYYVPCTIDTIGNLPMNNEEKKCPSPRKKRIEGGGGKGGE
jgi:hypothetical protein